MKKIEAIVDPAKLDEFKETLRKEKIPHLTGFEVKRVGIQERSVWREVYEADRSDYQTL